MSDEITGIIEAAAADLSAAEPAPSGPEPSSATPGEASAPSPTSTAPSTPSAAPAEPAPAADPAAPPAAPSSPSKAEAAEDAELSKIEQELVAKNASLKHGRMSMARHQAVLALRRREYEAAMARAAERLEAAKQYEAPEFRDRLRAFEIAEKNPDQFLQILYAIPDYRTRLEAMVEQALLAQGVKAAVAEPEEETEPQPDTLLEGGGMGYSTERANQLWEYRLRQARQEYDQKLAALEEGLAPIKQERQTREIIEQAYTRQGGILADARKTWPLFSQYEGKIRAELSKPGNERMQLEQAYRQVVVTNERADRARIEAEARARIQQELNGHAQAPRNLRPGLPEADQSRTSGDGEIEAIIRHAARSLG